MKIQAALLLAFSATAVSLTGCAICCGPDDYNYAAYGGAIERVDMAQGRVGSAFYNPAAEAVPSHAAEPGEPTPADAPPSPPAAHITPAQPPAGGSPATDAPPVLPGPQG